MKINGKEVRHVVIRNSDGDDIIYIGEKEIINQSGGLTIHIADENHNEIPVK